MKHFAIERILHPTGLWGCKKVGIDIDGNAILKINREVPLGKQGELIHLVIDSHIYENVRKYGIWAGAEVEFLTNEILGIARQEPSEKITFIDAGAHCGLVARQVVLQTSFIGSAVLIEPVPQHASAARFNVTTQSDELDIHVINAALSGENSKSTIYIEDGNTGNSSLFKSMMGLTSANTLEIETICARDFSTQMAGSSGYIVLKSDLQGHDAQVLASFSGNFWSKVRCAVFEIISLPEVLSTDVEKVVSILKDFSFVSWNANGQHIADLDEISLFWLSGRVEQRNLFVRK